MEKNAICSAVIAWWASLDGSLKYTEWNHFGFRNSFVQIFLHSLFSSKRASEGRLLVQGGWFWPETHLFWVFNQQILIVFSGSDGPSGTYVIAVSKTHKNPYLTEVYILVRTQNTDVPISGNKLARKLHKSSLFNWWLRNCKVKTLLIPCAWFQCTQKDVTFGKQDCMG